MVLFNVVPISAKTMCMSSTENLGIRGFFFFTERNPRSCKPRVIFRFSDISFQFVTSSSIDTITTTILTFHSNVSISREYLILNVN